MSSYKWSIILEFISLSFSIGHYCQTIKTDRFWQEIFSTDENFNLDNLPLREPAHIFLQMVSIKFFALYTWTKNPAYLENPLSPRD